VAGELQQIIRHRTGAKHRCPADAKSFAILCNEQVAPGLGFEGSFLAATSVARLVAGQYKRQDWLRRGPWSGPSV